MYVECYYMRKEKHTFSLFSFSSASTMLLWIAAFPASQLLLTSYAKRTQRLKHALWRKTHAKARNRKILTLLPTLLCFSGATCCSTPSLYSCCPLADSSMSVLCFASMCRVTVRWCYNIEETRPTQLFLDCPQIRRIFAPCVDRFACRCGVGTWEPVNASMCSYWANHIAKYTLPWINPLTLQTIPSRQKSEIYKMW